MQTCSAIPAHWVAYNAAGLQADHAVAGGYGGVVCNFSDDAGSFDDLCGQEVRAGAMQGVHRGPPGAVCERGAYLDHVGGLGRSLWQQADPPRFGTPARAAS